MSGQDLSQHKIGWIGTGRMGFAMAQRLLKGGADVAVWNRTKSKAEPLATGFAAVRAGIVMFTIPFVFAFYPELLLIEQAQLAQSIDGASSAEKSYLPGYDGSIDWAGLGWLLIRLLAALYLVASALTRFDAGHLSRFEIALRVALALLVLLKIPTIASAALIAAVALVAFHKFRHWQRGETAQPAD